MEKKNIVIVGAGFGGVRAAQDLGRALKKKRLLDRYQVVLVDHNAYHTYTPLLPKLAATTDLAKTKEALLFPIAPLLNDLPVAFLEDTVRNIDPEHGTVTLERHGELPTNFLVLAPGSEPNYFGIPGLQEQSVSLATAIAAERIHNTLQSLGANATIMIGGAGPTGVELAAELKISRPELTVQLIEGAPTILPGFHPRVMHAAEQRLRKIGVEIVADTMIASVENNTLATKTGEHLSFDLLVWTGGVMAPAWLTTLPLTTEARGRLEVDNGMGCLPRSKDLSLASRVYAIGDAVCFHDAAGKPLPGTARGAITQGSVAAHNVVADITGKKTHRSYRHINYPYVVTLGGHSAVTKIGPLLLRGLPAWLFKQAIELNYLRSIMSWGNAIRLTLRAF